MSKDLTQVDLEAELERLAERYRGANGPAIQILNRIAGSAETLLDRLPEAVRGQLDSATRQALEVSLKAASSSRQTVPDQSDWMNRVINTSLGAVGGIGGLPSALAELPC
jgi:hypothetical protein